MKTNEQKVIELLDTVRPYMLRDMGDMELVDIKEGVVYIRLLGACVDCLAQDETVRGQIESLLVENVPGVIAVEVVK